MLYCCIYVKVSETHVQNCVTMQVSTVPFLNIINEQIIGQL